MSIHLLAVVSENIGTNVKIGTFTTIHDHVRIEDNAVVAAMSVVLQSITIRKGTLVGIHSCVNRNTKSKMVYVGSPAKKICATNGICLQDDLNLNAYPWVNLFHRGYPDSIIESWKRREHGLTGGQQA